MRNNHQNYTKFCIRYSVFQKISLVKLIVTDFTLNKVFRASFLHHIRGPDSTEGCA